VAAVVVTYVLVSISREADTEQGSVAALVASFVAAFIGAVLFWLLAASTGWLR
jgi:hypothetical protein